MVKVIIENDRLLLLDKVGLLSSSIIDIEINTRPPPIVWPFSTSDEFDAYLTFDANQEIIDLIYMVMQSGRFEMFAIDDKDPETVMKFVDPFIMGIEMGLPFEECRMSVRVMFRRIEKAGLTDEF